MKATDLKKLHPGQLVRIRSVGMTAQSDLAADDFEIARIATDDLWHVPNVYGYAEKVEVEFDGLKTSIRGALAPNGTNRLVVVEKSLTGRTNVESGTDPWTYSRRLRIVEPREVLGVWDDDLETAALAARVERRAAADKAHNDAMAASRAQSEEGRQNLAEISPILLAAGVSVRSWYAENPEARVFSMTDMLAVIAQLAKKEEA